MSNAVDSAFKWARRKLRGPKGDESSQPSDSTTRLFVVESVPSYTGDPATQISAKKLKSILDAAKDDGEGPEQAALAEVMQERDPRLGGLIESRKNAILGSDVQFIPFGATPGTSAQDKDVKDFRLMLEGAGLNDLLSWMLYSLDVGYSGSWIEYGTGGGTIQKFHHIHPTTYIFDDAGNPAFRDIDSTETPVARFHPNRFVFHTNASRGTVCVTSGLCRKLAWLWFFKHSDTRFWVRYAEKFGMPFMIAKISQSDYDNATRKKAIITDLRKIASDGAIVTVDRPDSVAAVTAAGHDNSIHERLAAYIDRSYAISVLGQVGSSEGEKGKLGSSDDQQEVRADYRERDCRRLMETIQRQLIEPCWYFRTGNRNAPQFVMNWARSRDRKWLAEVFTTMDQRGWRATDEDVSAEMGIHFETQPMGEKESTPLVTKKAKVEER